MAQDNGGSVCDRANYWANNNPLHRILLLVVNNGDYDQSHWILVLVCAYFCNYDRYFGGEECGTTKALRGVNKALFSKLNILYKLNYRKFKFCRKMINKVKSS